MGAFLLPIAGEIIGALSAQPLASPDVQSGGIYRPSAWSQPAVSAITVPGYQQQSGQQTNPTTYVFDAVFRVDHVSDLQATDKPVQTGANITDHAYAKPFRVEMAIGASDAMDSYTSGAWNGGGASKGPTVYQTLVAIQRLRVPLTVDTRLMSYSNMLIESVRAADTVETLHGLAAIVVFRQIYIAQIYTAGGQQQSGLAGTAGGGASILDSSVTLSGGGAGGATRTLATASGSNAISARPQTTNATPAGVTQPLAPSAGTIAQHNIDSPAYSVPAATNVPGAGTWSSNNLSVLQ